MITSAFAQESSRITNPALSPALQRITGEFFLGNFISLLITILLIGGVIVFLFMLLMGGIQWMTSSGDKAGVEAARGRIIHALIGLLILFSAWAIILLIENFFGITILGGPIELPSLIPSAPAPEP